MERFFRVFWLQAIITFVLAGFTSILLFHFYKQQLALTDFLLADAISCGVISLIILMRRSIQTRRDMRLGFFMIAAALVFLIFVPYSRPVYYLYSIFQNIGIIMFYIPFNILFFKNTEADKRLRGMTWYWNVGIVSGVVGPLIGAFLFVRTGLEIFLAVPLALLVFGIYAVRFVPAHTITYSLRDVCCRIRRARLINLLDGALFKTNPTIGLFVLLYVNTAVEFGAYLSFVSLIMVGVSWLVAVASDKTNQRMRYLWPISLVAGVAVAAFAGVRTFGAFVALMILLRSVLVIGEPIRSNIMQDTIPSNDLNWISRELYLNLGRTILLFAATGFFILGASTGVFILFGILHVAFPFLVRYKKIYI